ncbi:MAG: 16S rRNA (adenine(1518)-N(6)/adenine(1519)-N(6))-dimethyltransferase RsmA [Candidatus Saccharimonadales bacterium]|nr:16S rRNA (adenine(1518)-N(6)/adenine(1519)-N(6))-dimethyltransferase RsmA [Candidatus Saccharimonadales bacterium]
MAKKELGQHWLNDQESLTAIIDMAQLSPHDTVLEIGPGKGALTKELLKKVSQVVAVEVDKTAIDLLVGTLPEDGGNIFLVHQDIRKFDLSRLPVGYKVVANIPYYITSQLIRLLLEAPNQPTSITLLVQKEVAERMTAKPGKLSVLGISVQLYADAALGRVVEAHKFDPPPKVDSQIVYLKVFAKPRVDVDPKKFFRLVKAGFSAKRKKLRGSLSGGLAISKTEANDLLVSAKVDPSMRAQELSLEQWFQLYNKLYN